MKVLKWLLVSVVCLFLLVGVGAAALVYLVDWNNFRETIQNQTKKHTGRDLAIAGDLKPTFFPWVGVSIDDISLSNAEGFGDTPFAKMGSADVKVKLMPLLKKEININTVTLLGLNVDLQRAADGTTNWDDLLKSGEATTTTVDENNTEVEVEGEPMAIAALAVGGIRIGDANVSWKDVQSGTDVKLADFNLETGAIELAKPFDLTTEFKLTSDSMALAADVSGGGELMVDLDNQVYSVNGLQLSTNARGDALPGGKLDTKLGANIMAKLAEQKIDIDNLSLDALGLILSGNVNVANLDTNPAVAGQLSSNNFSPLDLFATLGIDAPTTADPSVLKSASLSLALAASADSASLNDLTIKLDDTTFSGNASLPSLAGAVPPVRFKLGVDAIDLDRYLPPVVEGQTAETATTSSGPAATGDEPIELPLEMMRQLDIDGEFSVDSVKVKNLTTQNILVPIKAQNGVIALNGLKASLYQGQLDSNVRIDATSNAPQYAVDMNLSGIEADPLLVDLMQKDAFLSGNGAFAANITTTGNTVNTLTQGLNGNFNTAFNDGSVNGVNVGYQIRRAKAAFSGQSLPEDAGAVKTDFSELSVSANFTNGVMQSNDLDMKSPLLRLSGAGLVDLPGEQVDYTLTTLITGSAQGQGGEDLESLKGVKLDVPVRGSFDELAANFAGVILAGLKDNITNNIKGQVEARAKAEADKLKAQAQERLDAEEAKARARLEEEKQKAQAKLDEEKAKAQARLEEEKAKAQNKVDDAVQKGQDEVKNKLKGLFK